MRSTYDILQDLAGAWDTLSSKQKQFIGEKAAGIRQISVFNSVIDNFQSVRKATDDATNSLGSANKENEKFLDSIQGRLNTLSSAFQMLSANTIDSGLIKFFIEFATVLTTLIDKIGMLPALLTGLSLFTTIFSGNKVSGFITGVIGAIGSIPSTMGRAVQAFKAGKDAGLSFWGTLKKAGVSGQVAFSGAMVAISTALLIFDVYNKGIEEQSRKAKEFVDSWKKSRETLAETKGTIADIGGEFEKLGKGVDSFGNNISLTTDEFSKYHQITNQVAGMFPELVSGYDKQGNAILSVKSSVEALNDAYKAQIALANNAVIKGAPTVFTDTQKSYSSGKTFYDNTSITGKLRNAQNLLDTLNSGKTNTDWSWQGDSSITSLVNDMSGLANLLSDTILGKSITVKPEDVAAAKQFLSSYMRTIDSEIASLAGERKSIISAYLFNQAAYQGVDDQTKGIVDYVVANLDNDFVLQQDTLTGMMNSVYSTVLDPLTLNDGLIKTIAATSQIGESFKNSEKSISEYTNTYANLQKEMADVGLGEQVVEAVNKSMVDPKAYDPLVTNIKNKLSDAFDGMVGSMSLQDLRLASALEVPEGVLLTWDELQKRISDTQNTLTSLTLTEQVASIKTAAEAANTAFDDSAYYGSISKDQYDKLVALGDEYAATVDSTNGYLTVNKQKLDAIIASKQEETRAQIAFNKSQSLAEYESNATQIATVKMAMAGLAGEIDPLSDEYKKLYAEMSDTSDALETSQGYLRDEISAYDILASELNYATSAYKRWLDAKNSPEAGDGYDELSAARKAIDEGLKSGKTGTNKYKAAEALLIPEEISAQGEKAVSKYMKSMGKYLSEDSTGLQKYINDLYKKGFLTKDDTGTYFTTQKANIQDIAKELNITEEAARLMFAALKDYDWDVSIPDSAFDSSAAIAKLDEATAKWEDAKAYVEKLTKEGASPEAVAAAQAAAAAAEAERNAANVAVLQTDTGVTLAEKLAAQIAAYQEAINKLSAIGVPANLLMVPEAEVAKLQTQFDTTTNPLTPKFTVELDPITSDAVSGELDNIANKPRTAIITVDDTKLTEAEKRLAALHASTPPLSVQYGGTGGINIPEDALGYREGSNQDATGRTDGEVSIAALGLSSGKVTDAVNKLAEAITEEWAGTGVATDGLIVPVDTTDAEVSLADLGLKSDDAEVSLAALELTTGELVTPKVIPISAPNAPEVGKEIDAVADKYRTATIVVQTQVGSGAPAAIKPYAKGTKRAKRGVALTGEKGVETVFGKDEFYTVGHDGPELVNLKGGEEILPADETKKMFGRKKRRQSGQAFGLGTSKVSLLDMLDGFSSGAAKSLSTVTKKIIEAIGKSNLGGNRGKSGKGGKPVAEKPAAEKPVVEKSMFDWIPRLLDRLRKQTEKLIEQSESLVDYTAQNAKLDEAVKSNQANIKAAESAYTRYIKEANKVKGLSSSLIGQIKNGSINIGSYSEETQKLISEYQKWYDLAQGTLDTVTELKAEQKELALQKLDNVKQYYENRLGGSAGAVSLAESKIALKEETGQEVTAADYTAIIAATIAQQKLLMEERAAYEAEFSKLVASGMIKKGSDEWYEYTGNLNDMDVAINAAAASLDEFRDIAANIEVKNLEIAMKYLNTVQSTLESLQGLREAQGNALTADDYENLISVGMQQIETLKAQNDVLKEQQSGLALLSDEYQEIQDQIDGNLGTIWDIKTEQEGWNDAIIDLDIARLQEVNDEYDKQFRTMEAIENLEKARQRRNRVYREGVGFVYEADQSGIKTAQREYDDVMFENLIDTLEGLKDNNNVYDGAGNLIGTPSTAFDGIDLTNYLTSPVVVDIPTPVLDGMDAVVESSSALAAKMEMLAGVIIQMPHNNVIAPPGNVTFGNIVLQGVNDAEGLAGALRAQLPSLITQLWFSNK